MDKYINTHQDELDDPDYCPHSTSHKHEFDTDEDTDEPYCVWCGVIES